jgi:peptidoglycan/LPS O-acetylase OafA/YrhL
LGNPFLVGIGKISYGIYLYHNFIPVYLKGIRGRLVKLHPDSGLLPFIPDSGNSFFQFYAVCFALLFLLAFCSFRFFEQPLLALKNKIS